MLVSFIAHASWRIDLLFFVFVTPKFDGCFHGLKYEIMYTIGFYSKICGPTLESAYLLTIDYLSIQQN